VPPDTSAFRELETLVRNLTEQLAGYRRRAMAAEARARDLEQSGVGTRELSDRAEQLLHDERMLRAQVESELVQARLALQESHREKAEIRAAAEAAIAELAAENKRIARGFSDGGEARAISPVPHQISAAESAAADSRLISENTELRRLLADARQRSLHMVERVRFMRQQIGLGVEK